MRKLFLFFLCSSLDVFDCLPICFDFDYLIKGRELRVQMGNIVSHLSLSRDQINLVTRDANYYFIYWLICCLLSRLIVWTKTLYYLFYNFQELNLTSLKCYNLLSQQHCWPQQAAVFSKAKALKTLSYQTKHNIWEVGNWSV